MESRFLKPDVQTGDILTDGYGSFLLILSMEGPRVHFMKRDGVIHEIYDRRAPQWKSWEGKGWTVIIR